MSSRAYSLLTDQQKVDTFMRWHNSLSPTQKASFNAYVKQTQVNKQRNSGAF